MSLLYFPPGMFPVGYFPPAYFPGVGGPTPELPGTLPAAIVARFDETPSCSWIEGGLTYGDASTEDSITRYVVFARYPGRFRFTTGYGYARRHKFRFWCNGTNDDECERMVNTLIDVFSPREIEANPLVYQGGRTVTAIPSNDAMDMAQYIDTAGHTIKVHFVDIEFESDQEFPADP